MSDHSTSHALGGLLLKKKIENSKCWQRCEKKQNKTGTPVHNYWECKMMQLVWKTIRWLLKRLELPQGLAISLLGIYPKELKAGTQTDIYLYIHVNSSIRHNSQKLTATQFSTEG